MKTRDVSGVERGLQIFGMALMLAATPRVCLAADYEWTFSGGNLAPALGNGVMNYADAATPGLTTFGVTDGSTVPNINGQPAFYMRVPGFADTANGYKVILTDSGPNGGGAYINQYTFIFDIYSPGSISWTPIFNTHPNNINDADFYIDPNGALGIGALGYSAAGIIVPDTWYRITFTADLGAGNVAYYVNGVRVHNRTGGSLLDGRFSLYSNLDADPTSDLLLFNEGDLSGVYTHELLVSSVFLTDRMMLPGEILALGGPQAGGIIVPEPGTGVLLGLSLAALGAFGLARRLRDDRD